MHRNIIKSTVVAAALCSVSMLHAAEEIIEPTGLDQIQEIIANDTRIEKKVTAENIAKAQAAAESMNAFIKEAIKERGLANDGVVSVADAREVNRYLVENYGGEWTALRADYALVNKSSTLAMAQNAVKLWGKIYDLGFEAANKNRLSNINGGKSGSFVTVGYQLGEIVKNDVASGALNNSSFQEVVGTTGTSMDQGITLILNDPGLQRKIATGDLREGAKSADALNHLILGAIRAEGLANDGTITTADTRTLNAYLVANNAAEWAELHGDDEEGEETGYHLVQNDGAYSRMFSDNFVNSVADGVYHLGFPTRFKNNLENEDGNKNKRFEKVAWWLNECLEAELASGALSSPYSEVTGTTGTILDQVIPLIYNDEGLLLKVSMSDIRAGAAAANGMNELLVEAIQATGVVADDNDMSIDDVKALNAYLVENHATQWATLHGDDEEGEETGYHRVQNDGAISMVNGRNALNNLVDGVYHLGFPTTYKNNLTNEDGNKNVSFRNVSYWFNKAFHGDFSSLR